MIRSSSPLRALLAATLSATLSISFSFAQFSWEDHYRVENIPLPENIDPQFGGLDFTKDGKLIACFHRGEVMIYHEGTQQWSLFATGLHEPLGIYAEDDGSVLVIQRAELTRLTDTDQDGTADLYETVCDDWGLSGNYHEFAFGIVKDSQKNIFISLGTASNGSGVREEIRGNWDNTGNLTQDKFLYGGDHGEWNKKKRLIPRMYARVPYRGCILKIKPNSRKAEIYATGVRTPNGLYLDKQDQLWCSDNQGDWLGSSKLHRILPDQFHGHPASLLWSANPPTVTPSLLPVKELNAHRVKAPALFPQGDCANSLTQILPLTAQFAPLDRRHPTPLIIGEMNHARLVRYLPDLVNGQHQGSATHLLDSPQIGAGTNRMVYSPDGQSLYLGKTHLSWPGAEGLKKITYNGKPYLQIQATKLTQKGFEVFFNAPVTASKNPSEYQIQSYESLYHDKYGSPKENLLQEAITRITTTDRSIIINLKDPPKKNRIYAIALPVKTTSTLGAISARKIWYTVHQTH